MVEDATGTPDSETTDEADSRSSARFAPVTQRYWDALRALRAFAHSLRPLADDLEATGHERLKQELKDELEPLLSGLNKEEALRVLDPDPDRTVDDPRLARTRSWITFRTARLHAEHVHHQHALLNRSVLVSLVSAYEVLIGRLTREYFLCVPSALSGDDKVFSFNELSSFPGIPEAVDHLVSRRVDDMMKGSMSDWSKFFQQRLKLDPTAATPHPAQWLECFQRRNLIVHADGYVNTRYINAVNWAELGEEAPRSGSYLRVDDEYLDKVLDLFEIAGVAFAHQVWAKLLPDQADWRLSGGDGTASLGAVIFDAVSKGRWVVAEHLARYGEGDDQQDAEGALVCRYNRWLAVKRQGRWEEIKGEVSSADISHLSARFSVAHFSLLDDASSFFDALPAARADGLSDTYLAQWPILDEMRSDERFPKPDELEVDDAPEETDGGATDDRARKSHTDPLSEHSTAVVREEA